MEIDRDVDVLIVDDNAANLLTYEGVLEALQVNLVKAHSGQEALRHAFKNDFAAILMDVQMPEMNGFETAKLLRQARAPERRRCSSSPPPSPILSTCPRGIRWVPWIT